MPSFHDFRLQPATSAALATMGITVPTPVQAEAIPALMAGNDVVGQSATGSGKTLAYGIPLVERLARDKRVVQALVLVPTRELAIQVNTVLSELAAGRRLFTALLVGGRPYGSQLSALRYGAQIVVGTPGRVKDHLDRGTLELSHLRICILDEADQMLDSGFAPAIEEILATTPDTRQMALFSATIPDWIATLQEKYLKNPVEIAITPASGTQSSIEQIAYQIPHDQKMAALCTLLNATAGESSLIFGKTKHGVEKLGKQLSSLGFTVGTLHGNKSQRAREETLTAFRRGQVQTLLATNVAARGLDIQDIYQVINYELPESSELFTHRIGRTGRMGKQGRAITLLVPSDLPRWRRMARSLGQIVTLQRLVIDEEPHVTPRPLSPEPPAKAPEPNSEQPRQKDNRKLPIRERARDARPEYDSEMPSGRKHKQPVRERSRDAQPEYDDEMSSGRKQRQRERPVREAPVRASAWQPESFPAPERRSRADAKKDRRGAGRPPIFAGPTRERQGRRAPAPRPSARGEFGATPGVQRRRASGAKRYSNGW